MKTEPPIIDAELVPEEPITVAGSGRMATYMLPRFAEWKKRSQRTFDVDLVSPNATQLVQVTRDARGLGLPIRPVEAKIEDVLAAEDGSRRSCVLGIDDVVAIEKTLRASIPAKSRILITLFLEVPGQGLLGLVILLGPDDDQRKGELAKLFAALKPVSMNDGADAMFARPANRSMEPMMRALMVNHVTGTLEKFLAGLPAHADVLVTRDGRSAMRLVIEDSGEGFKNPDVLARSVMANVTTPLKPGSDFMIAEIGPGGVRFHSARLRAVDGQITINGAEVVDTTPTLKEKVVDTLDQIRDSALARAIEKATRNTITNLNPAMVSD